MMICIVILLWANCVLLVGNLYFLNRIDDELEELNRHIDFVLEVGKNYVLAKAAEGKHESCV